MRMLINNTDVSGTMQIDSALNKNSLSAVSNKAVTTSILSVATCNTVADDETKTVTIDGFTLSIGCTLGIIFTNGNSYGETTLDTPTYPKLSINNGTSYPICDSRGHYAGKGFCNAGDYIELRYIGDKFIILNSDVRESVQGESGYTIYSNDYFECWGKNTVSGTSGIIVTLPISYKDLTYKVFAQTSGTSGLTVIRVTIKTVNSFQLLSGVQTIGYYETTALWKTEGYI